MARRFIEDQSIHATDIAVALRETVQAWTARDREQAREWILAVSRSGESRFSDQGAGIDVHQNIPESVHTTEELDHAVAGHVLALAESGYDPAQVRSAMEAILDPATRRAVARMLPTE